LFHPPQPSSQLRARLGQLPEAERRVADVLLSAPGGVIHDSVGRLATRAETSPATVVRLSRRLGYEGFAALKIAMAQEAGGSNQFGLPTAGAEERAPLYRRVMASDARSIVAGAQSLDPSAFEHAHTALAEAGDVLFAGVGFSSALAALSSFRFMALGLRVSSFPDALSQHLRAGALGSGDVCVAISHTGESRDTIEAVTTAGQAGATTIGITSFAGSPLTQAVQHALICADEEDTTRQELFANPVAIVSVLGALHAAVAMALPATTMPAHAARLIASHQY
jgi:RpiR family transcriptional regulator, carbohydrate utilization regulator